jgi:ribA/ribD-fused uncharacterized protein
MPKIIDNFDGEYAFLSNFYESPIKGDDGITYPTVEHFFQAMKTEDLDYRKRISWTSTPGIAKRMGRTLQLRPDWEAVKEDYMHIALIKKFAIPELQEKLLATGDAALVEGTTWHDQYWGVCNCAKCMGQGFNRLGYHLQQVREFYKH